ncbi:MAG: hypothetical protein JNK54_09575 [Elusimicrobia bacterium]|jgi:hypothetical protein|nr:hypothetical protein [Elusimicrobiota bacterium]
MKKLFPLLLFVLSCLSTFAQTEEKTSNAKLRLPWEILQGVLKLDAKDVRLTWEEYRTILRLTSSKKVPDFSMSGGDVILSREEFTRLVQSLIPPALPAAEAFVSKASYKGQLHGDSALFAATLRLEIPQRPAHPIRFDLFPANVAFQEIKLNDRHALAEVENGRLILTIAEPGSHKVTLHFSVPVPESYASQSITIPIARTPITEWTFDIFERNLDIAVPAALHRELSSVEKGTRVRVLLPPSTQVTATWNPLAPDTAKGPAHVYADVDHLISVQEDALRVVSQIGLDVLQNTINTLTLDLPDGFTVLDVKGDAVRDWQENGGSPSTLSIPFKAARKGRMDFVVILERVLPVEKTTTIFTGLTVRGAVRQRGHLGVELNSDAELPPPVTEGLDPKDPFRELPSTLTGQSTRLLFGYKYVRTPFSLALTLARHESVNLIPAVIDRAEGTSVIRPDGKIVHRVTYSLRSSAKQFLEVSLPKGAQLWSAFVEGAPVKPVQGDGDKTLIPLVRSLRAPNNAFPVELVYYEERPRLSFWGRENLQLPIPDVLVSRLQWSVVTPPDQNFIYFGREFEKPERPGFTPFKQMSKGFIGGRAVRFASAVPTENQVEPDSERTNRMMDISSEQEVEFSVAQTLVAPPSAHDKPSRKTKEGLGAGTSATVGLLPVRVAVPSIGNSVTYSKTLPEPNALLTLPLYHVAEWVKSFLWFVPMGLLALGTWFFRKTIRKRLNETTPHFQKFLQKYGGQLTPSRTLFFCLVALLGASYGPRPLFWFVLVFFSGALVRWVLSLFDPSEGEKT